ncbi:hypothetical protein [Oceanithermus desulfurans]|uniref:Lipoprotein n=2 Tax=Oceanithermus desulfurans TaxID=227924 RepID=A0A511RJN9_9DEIN|nr:hypothetical protein [Oceanithermus desulfurans]MBB6029901.1 hypothetical protein [Oceanithermus desulfurans]GEM89863.1 hypothetical protein ODE01S_12970 [Oceanithermus desulfurans NBRC 100063]
MPGSKKVRWFLVVTAALLALVACNTQQHRHAAAPASYPYEKLTSVGQQLNMVRHVVGDVIDQLQHRYWGWERFPPSPTSPYKDFYRDVPGWFYPELERVFAQAARIQPLLRDGSRVSYTWHQIVRLSEATEVAPHTVVDFRISTERREAGRDHYDVIMRAVVDLDRWKILYWKAWARPLRKTVYGGAVEKAIGCARLDQPFRFVLPPGVDFDDLSQSPEADRIVQVATCRSPRRVVYYDNRGGIYERRVAQSAEGFELVRVAEFDPADAR